MVNVFGNLRVIETYCCNQLIGECLPCFVLADDHEMQSFYWSVGVIQSINHSVNQSNKSIIQSISQSLD